VAERQTPRDGREAERQLPGDPDGTGRQLPGDPDGTGRQLPGDPDGTGRQLPGDPAGTTRPHRHELPSAEAHDEETRAARARDERFGREVAGKAARRERAAGRPPSILAWMGTFGMIGWTIAVPAILGVFVGRWLDDELGGSVSWTLTLLLVGIVVGAAAAWSWMRREGGA
jgi:ATP synthase protein I